MTKHGCGDVWANDLSQTLSARYQRGKCARVVGIGHKSHLINVIKIHKRLNESMLMISLGVSMPSYSITIAIVMNELIIVNFKSKNNNNYINYRYLIYSR